MSAKTSIAAIAAFVAVAAVPAVASAHADGYARAAHHRALRYIPSDAYGAYGYGVQTIRPSELTGGQGYDFQLGGRF